MGRILVVEDDEDVLDLISALLTHAGQEVAVARDGREALDLLLAEPFGLCVLDHDLPHLTGLEVVAATREHRRATRFVLVSGSPRLTHRSVASVDAFVRKPFDDEELLALVEEMVAG